MYQEESFKTSKVIYAHTRSNEADMEYKMHCHGSYEIYYMITGNVEYMVEGRTYIPRPGSLVIIPPGCFHGLRILDCEEYHRIRLHFMTGIRVIRTGQHRADNDHNARPRYLPRCPVDVLSMPYQYPIIGL